MIIQSAVTSAAPENDDGLCPNGRQKTTNITIEFDTRNATVNNSLSSNKE